MYTVLLVEDSLSDAKLFDVVLKGCSEVSFHVTHVTSLKTAVSFAADKDYDAIVIDLGLPDSWGLETYRTLRDVAPHSSIIVWTGQTDRTLCMEALREGADNYIVKELLEEDHNRLAVAILAAVRKSRAAQPKKAI